METKKIIEQTIELINDETKWTREAYARNNHGMKVNAYSPEATCWCVLGAIWKLSSSEKEFSKIETNLNAFSNSKYQISIAAINDNIGREEVIKILQEYVVSIA